jgi:hypothetical protein
MIKSRRMRWIKHKARMEKRNSGFWLGSQKKRDHLEDLVIGGRIILKYIGWGDMD